MFRRSPLGLRGLKSFLDDTWQQGNWSQPSWAAWIEITRYLPYLVHVLVAALLAAWIEITYSDYAGSANISVAALLGCVD